MKPGNNLNVGGAKNVSLNKGGHVADDQAPDNIKDIYKNPDTKKGVLVEIYQAVSVLYGKFFADIFRSVALTISNDEGLRHIGEQSRANISSKTAISSEVSPQKYAFEEVSIPSTNQFLAFEKWYLNNSNKENNKKYQADEDLADARIYAEYLLKNKLAAPLPNSAEEKKSKAAEYLLLLNLKSKKNENSKIEFSKTEKKERIEKKGELSEAEFFLDDADEYSEENKINSDIFKEEKVSGVNSKIQNQDDLPRSEKIHTIKQQQKDEKSKIIRELLLREYEEVLGAEADMEMPDELLIELIKKRRDIMRRNDNSQSFSSDANHLGSKFEAAYDSEQDDEIPMDDDSEDENDQDCYRTENNFLNGVLENTSNNLPSSFNDGSSSQSKESLDSRMTEWRRDDLIINAIRSENKEMLEEQRAFDKVKKNAVNLTDLNRDDNRPTAQAPDALESEFPLSTSLFVDKKLGPPPPPPPPRNQLKGGISTSGLDAASVRLAELVALRLFPNVDPDQLSKTLTGADAHEDFNSLVYGAEGYFESLASNSHVDDAERLKAVTLAKIWEGAAQDSRRLSGMKDLKDYALLNALLNSEKISKDFKNE
jgi:hypothetical protein